MKYPTKFEIPSNLTLNRKKIVIDDLFLSCQPIQFILCSKSRESRSWYNHIYICVIISKEIFLHTVQSNITSAWVGLFDSLKELQLVELLRLWVHLSVITMKGYFKLSRSSKLEPGHQLLFSHTKEHFFWGDRNSLVWMQLVYPKL